MEQIAGIISGPAGSLVGAGLQIIVSKIASGSRSPNNPEGITNARVNNRTPRNPEYPRIMTVYDEVEAHLHGAMRVLKPAMEIRDILMNQRSKSADVRSGKAQESEINYYTPQKNRSQSVQRGCKCSQRVPQKSRNDESVKENFSRASGLQNSRSFISSSPVTKRNRSLSSTNSTIKLSNISRIQKNDSSGNSLKYCEECGISGKAGKHLALMSCGHGFCHRCISPRYYTACPICKKPSRSSNTSSFNYNT